MKIINLITSVNGIVESVESYIIDKTLSELDNKYFFGEKEAVKIIENRFENYIKENNGDLEDNTIDFYFDQGYIEFINKRHETIELFIIWSGINVKE